MSCFSPGSYSRVVRAPVDPPTNIVMMPEVMLVVVTRCSSCGVMSIMSFSPLVLMVMFSSCIFIFFLAPNFGRDIHIKRRLG